MKINWKKYTAAVLTAAMTTGLLGGCAQISINDASKEVVATYGDENIYLDEARFMAKYNQYQMEEYYGPIMRMMGAASYEDYWKMDPYGTGTTMEDQAKTSTMQQILQTRVLCDKAETDGISLTEEETAKVTEAVDQFMANERLVEITGATRELAERIYTQNALANKVYETMVQDVDTNVDEAEVLRKTLEYIKITEPTDTTASEETTAAETESTETESQETDAAGETAAETESAEDTELRNSMMEAAEAIQTEIESGTELQTIEDEYAEAEFNVNSFADVAISAADTEDYKTTAWSLSAGECAIVESDDGSIYVLHLLNDRDEEKTQNAIDTEIENRRTELFQTRYEELTNHAPTFKVKDDVWESVTYQETAYVDETTEAAETTGEGESAAETTSGEEESQEETAGESASDAESASDETAASAN
ncbi:MAG TPA: hypothetical protein IAB48_04600 [Candidatus Fimimorpha excrementavium]|nr:hypothetical protein [Candidatus Fimimorpha excrementavium]